MTRSTLWFVYIIIPLLYSSCVLSDPPYSPPWFLEDAPGALPDYSHCFRLPFCDPAAKYRTSDGTCNNLQNPLWGSSSTPFARLLPAVYSDGLREVRKAKSGGNLPSARPIHTKIFVDADRPSFDHTTALMEWGQVMTHDIAGRVERPAFDCCTSDHRIPTVIPKWCIPIPVPKNDPYLSHFNATCSPMKRSVTSTDRGCKLKPDQQISGSTHYMDASVTYGSTKQRATTLRAFRGGLLRVQTNGKGEEFPPNAQNTAGICLNMTERHNTCYLGGDHKTNQQMNIAAVQIVLLREHNRLARRLATLNPKWNDERLYQEARRILIAQFQHITYSEYLPHIIVPFHMNKNDLYSLPVGLRFDYNASIHVNVLNEFTSAVFRVFHSNVPSNIDFLPESRKCPYASFKMNDWIFNPSLLQDHLDSVLRSMVTQPQQELDRFITIELSEKFAHFQNPFFGFDVVSLDIMRGRDHGLPPYNALRKICGLPKARKFHDLNPNFSTKNIKFLQRLYKHPDDIDAFVGCMLEEKYFDKAGFTSQCIMAEQFRRLKFGDRNFYEFGGQPGSFTQDQIEAIREGALFSALLCRNTKIQSIQWNGFNTLSSENPLFDCRFLPKLDLLPWKE